MAEPTDPFFDLPDDSEWNACIGRQATEENYVDGYIEAAIELASAVIEKRLHGQRDSCDCNSHLAPSGGLQIVRPLRDRCLDLAAISRRSAALPGEHRATCRSGLQP